MTNHNIETILNYDPLSIFDDVEGVEGVTSTLLLTAQQLQRSDMTIQVFAE